MATANSTSNEQDTKTLMFDDDRRNVALSATYDIEELGNLVGRELNNSDDLRMQGLRHLTKSIVKLNSIVMSALGDELESTESLQARFD